MLSIHKSYLNSIEGALSQDWLLGLSHITGGGLEGNTNRVIPSDLNLNIDWDVWEWPNIFNLIQTVGKVPTDDMKKSFNLGIGMVLIIKKDKKTDKSIFFTVLNFKFFTIVFQGA